LALYDIAIHSSRLSQQVMQCLESILIREGLERDVYLVVAWILSHIAIYKPDLFTSVYSVIERLSTSGKDKQVKLIKQEMIISLPDEVPSSMINIVKGEDWAIVLREIDRFIELILSKADAITLLFNPSRDDKTHLSVTMKQKVYRNLRDREGVSLKEHSILMDRLSLYTGAYKLPWKEFRDIMDNNYDAFHKDPAPFVDITDEEIRTLELPSKPEAPDMVPIHKNKSPRKYFIKKRS
jgi:hypothetical protein